MTARRQSSPASVVNKRKEAKEKARQKYIAKSGPCEVYPPVGHDRYHANRFLADCLPATRDMLVKAWKAGKQLAARRVPVDALPAVVILACYAEEGGAHLVDDYEALLSRYKEHITECTHNDKFFASCILLLAERYQAPSDEAWDSINIPGIYEELLG